LSNIVTGAITMLPLFMIVRRRQGETAQQKRGKFGERGKKGTQEKKALSVRQAAWCKLEIGGGGGEETENPWEKRELVPRSSIGTQLILEGKGTPCRENGETVERQKPGAELVLTPGGFSAR